MSSDNLGIADNRHRYRITQGDVLVAEYHLPSAQLFVVTLLDPLGAFGGVATFGPAPHQVPEVVFNISKGFFSDHMAIVVSPPPDNRVEFLHDLVNGGLAVGHQNVFEVGEMGLNLFLLGFDQQLTSKASEGETQEIEPFISMNNPGLGLIER